jgi:NADH:ubiquinone oxidoreductase subunit 4 (subunit M)
MYNTIFCFFISIFFWILFDRSSTEYQFTYINYYNNNINGYLFIINKFAISLGIDGISLFFILLTTFIIPICILTSYKVGLIYVRDYCIYLLLLEIFLIISFSATDLITFFIAFETILIPMYFIIGIWGSRERRVKAGFLFFLYTLFGSIFLFFTILILYYDIGSTNFNILAKIDIDLSKQIII